MRSLIIFLLFIFPLVSFAEKVCLNMIVKDESAVIKRCLDSVIDIIDYWVIVDTGSTDGTQELIKEHLKDIPGEFYQSTWKNFGYNRSEAFEFAKGKGDYILFMDADDVLEFSGERTFGSLTQDLYNFWRGVEGFTYLKPQLVKADLPWKWVGVTHEYLACEQLYTTALLTHVKYVSMEGGACSIHPTAKFQRNIELLTEGIKEEPQNARYVFYLAESYRDAGERGNALEQYQRRVNMGGWEEEVFWSMLQIGHMLSLIGLPSNLVIEAYKMAHRFRPHRSEPAYYLAQIYIREKKYCQAYELLHEQRLIKKPFQKDGLFNMDWIESHGLVFQLSVCAYFMGFNEESLDLSNQLLSQTKLPDSWREQTLINRTYALSNLKKKFFAEATIE